MFFVQTYITFAQNAKKLELLMFIDQSFLHLWTNNTGI